MLEQNKQCKQNNLWDIFDDHSVRSMSLLLISDLDFDCYLISPNVLQWDTTLTYPWLSQVQI